MARKARKGKAGEKSPAASPTKQMYVELVAALQKIKTDTTYPRKSLLDKIDLLLTTDDPRKLPYSDLAIAKIYKEIMQVSASYNNAGRFRESHRIIGGIDGIATSPVLVEDDYV